MKHWLRVNLVYLITKIPVSLMSFISIVLSRDDIDIWQVLHFQILRKSMLVTLCLPIVNHTIGPNPLHYGIWSQFTDRNMTLSILDCVVKRISRGNAKWRRNVEISIISLKSERNMASREVLWYLQETDRV